MAELKTRDQWLRENLSMEEYDKFVFNLFRDEAKRAVHGGWREALDFIEKFMESTYEYDFERSIMHAFVWHDTPEELTYWFKVDSRVRGREAEQ
jgi:hypothetical protein